MKMLVSEKVIHFHEIEMSDELDIEQILDMANRLKKRCDTGYEAVATVLEAYKNKFGFEYTINPNDCGTKFEEVNYEYLIE